MVPLFFYESQVKFWDLRGEFVRRHVPVRIVACKARRVGISTVVQAGMYHDTTTNELTNTLIISNQSKSSENILRMCTGFWRNTPETVAGMAFRPRLPDSYNNNPPKDRLEFPDLESSYFVATAQSLDQYLGFFFQNIHATEAGAYKDGDGLFRSVMPTLVDEEHSMLVIESTPRGKSGRGRFFYEQTQEAVENHELENWEPGATRLLFCPWWEMRKSFRREFESDAKKRAFEKSLSTEEREVRAQIEEREKVTLELEQMLWRRVKMNGPPFNKDIDHFDQEYPSDLETAFLSSGTLVYGRKHIKRLLRSVREPIWRGDVFWGSSDRANKREALRDTIRHVTFLTPGESEHLDRAPHTNERTRANLRVWSWPERGDRLFICGDVGGGSPDTKNGDYSVIAVGRMNDWDQDEIIMTWRGRLNPIAFGEVASALAWGCARLVGATGGLDVVMPELTLEWNGPGVAANTWIDRHNLYPNTYRYVTPSVHGQPRSKHIGWESNSKTKPQMVRFSQRTVEQQGIDIPDKQFVGEMEAYLEYDEEGDVGSYGGESGTHDDCVTALQILCVRLRMEAGTGSAEPVTYLESVGADDDDDELPAWSKFEEAAETYDDDDDGGDEDDDDEEGLFYSPMRAEIG